RRPRSEGDRARPPAGARRRRNRRLSARPGGLRYADARRARGRRRASAATSMNIQDARAIVTGGGSGIGKATARLLAAKGAKVAICGRDGGRLERAAREIGAVAIPCDVSNEAEV